MDEITYETFYAGAKPSDAAMALDRLLANENPDMTYSQMMRYRLAGKASNECTDIYFLASHLDTQVARLWHGWGKHPNAIGNFGNFRTAEAWQRRGIGRHLLNLWYENLQQHQADGPLALFCTSSKPHLVKLYGEYGFRPALVGSEGGPLYCPLQNSPATFQEFCQQYYAPDDRLVIRPASIGWRHEIDCLLNFALLDAGESFAFPEMPKLEAALLNPSAGLAELIFTSKNHCIGWAFTPSGGERMLQLHPSFRQQKIEEN